MGRPNDEGRGMTVPVTTEDLDWKEWTQFIWYRIWHPLRRVQRPRASWAQIIVALGIKDTAPMTFHIADAESIPATQGTPIQRIKVRELGMLAFVMGFHTVELDITRREFRAYSPIGTITTQDSGIGKVLKFEGDIIAIHELISRCATQWVYRAADMVGGVMSFGKFCTISTFQSLPTIVRAITENMSRMMWHEHQLQDIRNLDRGYGVGPVYLEAMLMRRYIMKIVTQMTWNGGEQGVPNPPHLIIGNGGDPAGTRRLIYSDINQRFRELIMRPNARGGPNLTGYLEGCAARWQFKTGTSMPTIYVSCTFVSLHGVVCGFPSRSLLHPFIPWVRHRAQALTSKVPRCAVVSSNLSKAMTRGTLEFARETASYVMAWGIGASDAGTFSWGTTHMYENFNAMPEEVKRELVPNENEWEVNALLTPETARLLKDFDVDGWAASIMEANQTLLISFNPLNCLWIQVIVLDVAIQFFIHGHWGFETMGDNLEAQLKEQIGLLGRRKTKPEETLDQLLDAFYPEIWGRKEAAVVQGIVRAWRQPGLRETDDELALDQERNNIGMSHHFLDAQVDDDDDDDEEEALDWKNLDLELRDWDLAKALIQEPSVQFGDQGDREKAGGNRNMMCRRLAELLELRAVFVFAFLLLHPDSSDIYDSFRKEEDIEMPMA